MTTRSLVLLTLLICFGVGLMLTGKKWAYAIGITCFLVGTCWIVAGLTR